LDATLDEIEDLRLAVDEGAGGMLAAGPASSLSLRIDPAHRQVAVRLATDADADGWSPALASGSFAAQILATLVEDLSFAVEDGHPALSFSVPLRSSRDA
jgi:hypothetical protein